MKTVAPCGGFLPSVICIGCYCAHMTETTTFDQVEAAAAEQGLAVLGAFHPSASVTQLFPASGTVVLLGMKGMHSWAAFTSAREYADGAADPLDRWSRRIISIIADRFHGTAYFPFGGPPHVPFVAWALASGRAFTSPSQMLVHDEVGMLLSYRGALHIDADLFIPAPPRQASPCDSCVDRPCLSTCPAHALVDAGPYNLPACHDHLNTSEGADCMSRGCRARNACPLSAGADRAPGQNAHHMEYFHSS